MFYKQFFRQLRKISGRDC